MMDASTLFGLKHKKTTDDTDTTDIDKKAKFEDKITIFPFFHHFSVSSVRSVVAFLILL
jgi:hypothetical protein